MITDQEAKFLLDDDTLSVLHNELVKSNIAKLTFINNISFSGILKMMFFDYWQTVVSIGRLWHNNSRFFHDLENVYVFAVHELCLSIKFCE